MPDQFQPTQGSRANILDFLDTVQDEKLKDLLKSHLEDVLTAGRFDASNPSALPSRQRFFRSVEQLIQDRLEEDEA